ncbi:hypothetical protein [Oceanicella sp. SM1341]|uniref:hypothetical protein n=1 Tax=Oceanicella sp. SM1341 TaxID=1548889 RepID=UPI000E4D63A1|nr:hypothetical protein [Oceanicella sp. SM1341]
MSVFDPDSRYVRFAKVVPARDRRGREVQALTPAEIPARPELGEHLRREGQRLDHLAAHYLDQPAGYWWLVHHNGVLSADVLAEAPVIRIPVKG